MLFRVKQLNLCLVIWFQKLEYDTFAACLTDILRSLEKHDLCKKHASVIQDLAVILAHLDCFAA